MGEVTGCASVDMASKEQSDQAKQFSTPSVGNSGLYVYRNSFVGQFIKLGAFVGGADLELIPEEQGKVDVAKLEMAKPCTKTGLWGSSMRVLVPLLLATTVGFAGCAQTPEDQLALRSSTVRLCDGNACSEQDRRVATAQLAANEADPRMQALAKVAERNPDAAYDLGLRLLRGDGVERNSYQALEWLRKATTTVMCRRNWRLAEFI